MNSITTNYPLTILANVKQANLHYFGSITLSSDYKKIGLAEGMLCQIKNIETQILIATYIIYDDFIEPHNVCLNGAAAHRFKINDKVEITPLFLFNHSTEQPLSILNSHETPPTIYTIAQQRTHLN